MMFTQLSKGQLIKKRLLSVDIAGKKEEVYYSSTPCLGVKVCPHTKNVIMLCLSVTGDAAQSITYLYKGLVNAQLSLCMSTPKILMMREGGTED